MSKIAWYRCPVEGISLRELTRKSDLRGWMQAGSFLLIFLGLTGVTFWLFLQRSWVLMTVFFCLQAAFANFVGTAAACHELSHGTVFNNRKVNDFFYYLFCFLTWTNPIHFRASHRLHHQFTVFKGLDKEVIIEPLKWRWFDYLGWLTFDVVKFHKTMIPVVKQALGDGDADPFFWDPLFPPGRPERKAMCRWSRFQFMGQLALLVFFAVMQWWILIPMISFCGFFVTFLSFSCGMTQHSGMQANVPDWRLSCHTSLFNPLMSYLYWNMNYHVEHHSYAAVPFYKLGELHKAMKRNLPIPHSSQLDCIKEIFKVKRRQKVNPNACYQPSFPPGAHAPECGLRLSDH